MALGKGLIECLIDESNVRPVAGADRVPGVVLGGRGEQDEPELVCERAEAADALLFVAGGAVKIEDQRRGIARGQGNVQEGISLRPEVECIGARLGGGTSGLSGTAAEPYVGLRTGTAGE